ncbi:MAG: adenylyltransferase/cytidyltransferase family protein, partial [Candidatus Aenigmatarchaeota archaeon]
MTTAGFLGRFQPLHEGHYNVIKQYQEEYDDFNIVIGSAQKSRTEDNPLSFNERKELIHECFPDVDVIPLEDTEKDTEGNKEWAAKLESLGIDVVISRNDLVKSIIEEHTDLKLLEQDLYDKEIYSGTEVRRRIKSKEE